MVSIGPSYGKIGVVREVHNGANLTQGTARISSGNNISMKYLLWLLRSNISFDYWSAQSVGATFPALSLGILSDTVLPFTTNETEQTQIAKYLDHQTGLIDVIIEKKELLIKKLKEQRQAIINEAVTKGLNPNTKMKDSGIEWLGEVPEEWSVMKMKFGCEFILDGTHGSYKRVTEGYRLLSVRNIINDDSF